MAGIVGDRAELYAAPGHLVWMVDCHLRNARHLRIEYFGNCRPVVRRQYAGEDCREPVSFVGARYAPGALERPLLRSGRFPGLHTRQCFHLLREQRDFLDGFGGWSAGALASVSLLAAR